MVPPTAKMGIRNAAMPPAWYSGVNTALTSSLRSCQLTTVFQAFHAIIRCGIITPLGVPVVPLV